MENRPTSGNRAPKAVLYVATQDGAALGPSAQDQKAATLASATHKGLDTVGVFEDSLPTGGAAILERPGLLGAIETIRRHGGGVLVLACRSIVPATIDLALLIALVNGTGPRSRVIAAAGSLVRRGEDECRVTSVARCLLDLKRHVLAEEQERQRTRGIRRGGCDQVPDCWPPDAQ